MKHSFYILALLCTIILQACNTNMPEMNENNRKLLFGHWKLVKETVTNGDGFGGSFTRTENFLWNIDSYYIYDTQVVISDTHLYSDIYDYSLSEQKDGTWLVTVPGRFDKERNLEGGLSPITIHKLSKNALEWQFEAYGGDEGPVVYYQYLKKITDEPQVAHCKYDIMVDSFRRMHGLFCSYGGVVLSSGA